MAGAIQPLCLLPSEPLPPLAQEWLQKHLEDKIFTKIDALSANERLRPLLVGDSIEIDGVNYPSVQGLLNRITGKTAFNAFVPEFLSIVHGDLTPEHILIASDGMQPMAKVFNFGLSQRGAEAGVTNSTRIGSFLHMPYYSSPEHIANRAVDWRSDLWSLAVICHECLVGRRPFDSNNFGELLTLVVTEPIPPIDLPGGRTPAALQTWWKKAMSRDPEDRYQSAKEIADALGKAFGFPLVFVPEPMNSPLGLQASPAALPIVIRDSSVPPAPNPTARAITPNPKLKSTPASASSRPMQVAVRSQLSNPDSNRSMAKFSRHSTVIGLGVVSSTPPLPNVSWSGSSQRVLPPRPSGVTTGSDAPEPPPSSLKVDVDVVPLSADSHAQLRILPQRCWAMRMLPPRLSRSITTTTHSLPSRSAKLQPWLANRSKRPLKKHTREQQVLATR